MRLHDIHFCFGFVLGKRDSYYRDFILGIKGNFVENKDYPRQEIQRILHKSYQYNPKMDCVNLHNKTQQRIFRFIKHTIRNNKNY